MYHLQMCWWRRRRVPERAAAPPETAGRDPHRTTALRMSLERALDVLSPRQRAVIVLRYFEDQTEAPAAEVLGCSIGAVKRQHHDALARLRAVPPGEMLSLDVADSVISSGRMRCGHPPSGPGPYALGLAGAGVVLLVAVVIVLLVVRRRFRRRP